MVEYVHCISNQQNGLRTHGQRTYFEQHRIDLLSGHTEHAMQTTRGSGPHLEPMSKFLFNPCSHRRFRSATCQEQEILKINGLRQNRQLLVQVFRKFGWSSICWDKLKSCSDNSLTALPDVHRSDVCKRQDHGSSGHPDPYLSSELPVMSFEDVCK
jgi:hypothetical protein